MKFTVLKFKVFSFSFFNCCFPGLCKSVPSTSPITGTWVSLEWHLFFYFQTGLVLFITGSITLHEITVQCCYDSFVVGRQFWRNVALGSLLSLSVPAGAVEYSYWFEMLWTDLVWRTSFLLCAALIGTMFTLPRRLQFNLLLLWFSLSGNVSAPAAVNTGQRCASVSVKHITWTILHLLRRIILSYCHT